MRESETEQAAVVLPPRWLRRWQAPVLAALCIFDLMLLSWLADLCGARHLWLAAMLLSLALWAYAGARLPGSSGNLRYVQAALLLGGGLRALGRALRQRRLCRLGRRLECHAVDALAGRRSARSQGLLYTLTMPAENLLRRSLDYGFGHAG
jgi:hypothetical protein